MKLIFTLTVCFISLSVFSQTIKGKVTDSKTGEPLVGASVQVEGGKTKLITTVNLDGSYTFRNLAAGKYELKIKFVGYSTTKEFSVVLKNDHENAVQNMEMKEESMQLAEVRVT